MQFLGIDVAKDTFDVALVGGPQIYRGHFSNDRTGHAKLGRWLQKRCQDQVQACLEASGRYWEALALFLDEQGIAVSVVNPKLIKRHGETTMQRNKTDREDALTIADYCAKHQPDLWTAPAPAYQELKEMVRHVQALKADRQRERNRRQSGVQNKEVLATIDAHLAFLQEQIDALTQRINDHIDHHPELKADKDLLTSIPGVGDVIANTFMAEVPDVGRFPQASKLAAYAGLTPGEHRSGSSVHHPPKLVKWGNAHLRTAFYMPALNAHKFNPIVATLRKRLQRRGKSKMTIVVAIMRKLLHLCYGVLKTGKPFDPKHAINVNTA